MLDDASGLFLETGPGSLGWLISGREAQLVTRHFFAAGLLCGTIPLLCKTLSVELPTFDIFAELCLLA
jgi:hypothetical protein